MPRTRKLGRATDSRMAMLRAMVTYLFENGKIETTLARAKDVSSMAEKMITVAKEDNLHNKRMVMGFVTKESVTHKLFTEIALSMQTRMVVTQESLRLVLVVVTLQKWLSSNYYNFIDTLKGLSL